MTRQRKPVELPSGLPELATPAQVAKYLHTTVNSLAQMRYLGSGPKYIKVGHRVLYRWTDVLEWLQHNIIQRTDDPRGKSG